MPGSKVPAQTRHPRPSAVAHVLTVDGANVMPFGDYRIFVGAFPTGELAARIQQVRCHYDVATARITPPHVTLAGTYWRTGPPTPANESVLIEQLCEIELPAFALTLGGIHTFGRRVLYLVTASTPELLAVRRRLLTVMGQDKHPIYTPHLTLAMRLSPAALQAMHRELENSEWGRSRWQAPIMELWLMQRGPSDSVWRKIAGIPLL